MHRIALLALAAATLAACSDAPSAPSAKPNAAVAAPAAGIRLDGPVVLRDAGVNVTLQIGADSYSSDYAVAGTTVEFKSANGTTKVIADNGVGDANPAAGHFRVNMPKAVSYTATVLSAPAKFSLDDAKKTVSAFVTPTLVSMGRLALANAPAVSVSLLMDNALVGGQTIKVKGTFGFHPDFSVTVADNAALDMNPKPGVIELYLPGTGAFSICAASTPKTYWEADCTGVNAYAYHTLFSAVLTYEKKWSIPQL